MTQTETPAVWIDGHPQLEAIAAAVWERCGRSDSGLVIDDPRNIAVAALAALAAVLSASAGRAAALTEAADALERLDPVEAALAGQHAWKDAAALLRRLAAEAHDGDTHDDGQPAASRIRDLHQPMQRGPFTICAHCSGWDGKRQCRGVVTDYPCPTVRALDGTEPAAVVEHLGGKANAEDCPGCKAERRNLPYPFLCPAEAHDGDTQDAEAHPAEHSWAAELHDPLADQWVPGTRYRVRDRAVNALEHARTIGPTWKDGTPTRRRLVRATTTYTVEEPAVLPVGSAEPQDETRVVAYVLAERTDLHCLRCAPTNPGDIWTSVTAEELDDGGVCSVCGADVLIPQEPTA